MPEQQKQIHAVRMTENPKPPFNSQQPVIEFKYTPPPPPPKPKGMRPPDPTMFMPSYQPAPYLPTALDYEFYQQHTARNPPVPIIKNYQLEGYGPTGIDQTVQLIVEDSLPSKNFTESTYQTLGERTNLYTFIRSTIFSNTDGNNVSLDGKEPNSILSHVKFDELNPYNRQRYTNNPFSELPDNYLIYRSCYPIRKNNLTNSIICAKDATSINIRMYKMTEGSFAINRMLQKKKFNQYNEWRDLAYYEYVREKILKPKCCPNFVLLYGYFIAEKSNIDFSKINEIKNNIKEEKEPDTIILRKQENGTEISRQIIVPEDRFTKPKEEKKELMQQVVNDEIVGLMEDLKTYPTKGTAIAIDNPNAYKGKSLVLVTESPTYTLFDWASNLYIQEGSVKKMINRGVHNKEEWMNIYFQLMVGLYVMKKNEIYIKNFSIKNNVFIKDLTMKGQITNYWKYIVDGIEYYIPNLGYLVQIDSNYLDKPEIKSQKTLIDYDKVVDKVIDKVGGNCMGESVADIDKIIMDMFKQAIDPNNYSTDFSQTGGCKPPTEITTMLGDILKDCANNIPITDIISKYMKGYLHNRIGDYLKENEISNVRRDGTETFKKGNIALIEENTSVYEIVLLLKNPIGNNVEIMGRKGRIANVPVNSLFTYSPTEQIQQIIKPNDARGLSEDSLLEVYIV